MYKQSLFVMYKFTLLFTSLRLFVTYKFIIYIQVKLCCMYKQTNYVVQNPSLNTWHDCACASLSCACIVCPAYVTGYWRVRLVGAPTRLSFIFSRLISLFYLLTILFVPTHASEKGRAFFGLQVRSQ